MAALTADSCCVPEAQATCCEPSAKAECCAPGYGHGCGCVAGNGADYPDVRERNFNRRAATSPERIRANGHLGRWSKSMAAGVVSYEQVPATIVSAFANRKDPRSWSA